ncbi:receptor-transporting protein 4, partial [Cricetulus griseus]
IEQDSKLLTMPRPQPPPQKMLFSDASTWKQMFQELIQEEKPKAKWTLQLDKNILPNGMAQGWRQYQQTGIGRFLCSICDRYWVSAQVKILCHLYREPGKSQGQVLMRIFGQRCQKCTRSKFENPEFSMENIQRILENLVSYILRKYYGHGLKKTPSTSNERVHLDGPHDTANYWIGLSSIVVLDDLQEGKTGLEPPALVLCQLSLLPFHCPAAFLTLDTSEKDTHRVHSTIGDRSGDPEQKGSH